MNYDAIRYLPNVGQIPKNGMPMRISALRAVNHIRNSSISRSLLLMVDEVCGLGIHVQGLVPNRR
jgi:hypothetical protein